MDNLDKLILQELIYERIRVSVNLCQLVLFEEDLDKSIHRALARLPGSMSQQDTLARRYVNDAWKRLEREWEEMRDNLPVLGDNEDELSCP